MEVKDNVALRELKASKKTRYEGAIPIGVNSKSNCIVNNNVSEDLSKHGFTPMLNLDKLGSLDDDLLHPRKVQNCNLASDCDVHNIQDGFTAMAQNKDKDASSFLDKNVLKFSTPVSRFLNPELKHQTTEDVVILKPAPKISNATSDMKNKAFLYPYSDPAGPSNLKTNFDKTTKTFAVDVDEDVTLILDDVTQVKPTLNIRKESSTPQAFLNPGMFNPL